MDPDQYHESNVDYPPQTKEEQEGFLAARNGVDRSNNPYSENTDRHYDWDLGWWSSPTIERMIRKGGGADWIRNSSSVRAVVQQLPDSLDTLTDSTGCPIYNTEERN
jgi:hypothetical protein